jgi:hypothetical protein
LNAGVPGVCEKAFFGWYCSLRMEKLEAAARGRQPPAATGYLE